MLIEEFVPVWAVACMHCWRVPAGRMELPTPENGMGGNNGLERRSCHWFCREVTSLYKQTLRWLRCRLDLPSSVMFLRERGSKNTPITTTSIGACLRQASLLWRSGNCVQVTALWQWLMVCCWCYIRWLHMHNGITHNSTCSIGQRCHWWWQERGYWAIAQEGDLHT